MPVASGTGGPYRPPAFAKTGARLPSVHATNVCKPEKPIVTAAAFFRNDRRETTMLDRVSSSEFAPKVQLDDLPLELIGETIAATGIENLEACGPETVELEAEASINRHNDINARFS